MKPLPLLASLSCLFISLGLDAQTLYRCGSTLQDRPCEGQDGQVIGKNRAPARTSSDPYCAGQGKAAVQLRWQKDVGKTLEQQLTQPGANPDFIRYVYAKTGSAEDVRVVVESECEEDRKQAQNGGSSAGLRLPAANTRDASGAKSAQPTNQQEPYRTGIRDQNSSRTSGSGAGCGNLKDIESELQSKQKSGGDSSTMDDLMSRLRDVQSKLKNSGC